MQNIPLVCWLSLLSVGCVSPQPCHGGVSCVRATAEVPVSVGSLILHFEDNSTRKIEYRSDMEWPPPTLFSTTGGTGGADNTQSAPPGRRNTRPRSWASLRWADISRLSLVQLLHYCALIGRELHSDEIFS